MEKEKANETPPLCLLERETRGVLSCFYISKSEHPVFDGSNFILVVQRKRRCITVNQRHGWKVKGKQTQ